MNFIELRVEEYIDEALDNESGGHDREILMLRKFVQHLDRETEIYSVQDITEDEALDYLRILRNSQDRDTALQALNGFFGFLKQKGHVDSAIQLEARDIFRSKPAEIVVDGDDFLDEEETNMPRHRSRRAID